MEPPNPPREDIRRALNDATARTLRPLFLALAVLYALLIPLSLLVADQTQGGRIRIMWAAGCILFSLAFALAPRLGLPQWNAHAVLAAVALVVLTNTTTLVHGQANAFYGFVLALAVLGFSVLALNLVWYVGFLAAAGALWLSVLPRLGADPYVVPMSLVLVAAAAVGTLNEYLRIRAQTQLAILRAHEKAAQEEQIRRALEHQELGQLRTLDNFKNRFLNNAAHELGTPLTPIKVQLHLLRARADPDDAAYAETLRVLDRNVERLEDHVHQLLDAARVQAASLGLDPQRLSVRRLLAGAMGEARTRADDAGIQLLLDEGPDLIVHADERRMRQVLNQLIDNAIKFTPPGGTVRVSAEHQPNGIRIRIQDTGLGLSPEQIQRLFQPYEQLHETADIVRSGVGLGLYLSRAIVQLHGGQLWARSLGEAKGAEFMVDLPLAPSTSGTEAAATRSPSV